MGEFSFFHFVILAVIMYGLFRLISPGKAGAEKYCTACGEQGKPKTVTRGSIWIEIILWLCFIVPGVIYSIWRMTTRHAACASCGSKQLVPLDSPVARAHRRKLAD